MNRFLFLLIAGFSLCATAVQAQSGRYDDDVYYNARDARKDADAQAVRDRAYREEVSRQQQATRSDAAQSYPDQSSQGYSDQPQSRYINNNYDNSVQGDDYIDYESDNYTYGTNIRRFGYGFYNMGYYSNFYNPNWYDPYWSDPSFGWSVWSRPNYGYGYGPYWSSGWGAYNWYGYPGFSIGVGFGNPYYGGCFGGGCGYGYGGGFYGSPYSYGYWNGYYAGYYNSGYAYNPGYFRQLSYGPRGGYATGGLRPGAQLAARRDGAYQSGSTIGGFSPRGGGGSTLPGGRRDAAPATGYPAQQQTARNPRMADPGASQQNPRTVAQPDRGYSQPDRGYAQQPDRGMNNPRVRPQGGEFQQAPSRGFSEGRDLQPAQQQRFENQRGSQPIPNRSWSQPMAQPQQPQMEAPSRSYSAPPSRGFGGGNSGGGGGFGGGGGMRGGGGGGGFSPRR